MRKMEVGYFYGERRILKIAVIVKGRESSLGNHRIKSSEGQRCIAIVVRTYPIMHFATAVFSSQSDR